MARSPAIRGRPTPGRKSRSSASSSLGAASSPTVAAGTSGASSLLPIRTPIPKALKRAQKRAQLLSKASQSGQGVDGRPQGNDWTQISKSALRRRKRKARDELAKDESQGRQGGVKDLTEAMEEVEEEIQEEEEDRAARKSNPNPITAKQRQRVLEQESKRQKAILADPSFQASPFAALRQHLSHSMAR